MMQQVQRLAAKPTVVTVTSPMRMFCINKTKINPKP
jgi:hypothetical protein